MARAPASSEDLTSLSSQELTELLSRIETAIANRQKADRAQVKAQIVSLASEAGFTIEELFNVRAAKSQRSTVPAKFRNPDNPAETWSGRGRMAKWLSEKLKKRGAKLEDFSV